MDSSSSKPYTLEKVNKPFEFFDHTFKIIVVGSSGVGKTSFIKRAVENKFEENHTVTIAADFSKLYYLANTKRIKIQLWDTCGLEQYRSINKMYFRGSDIAIICYDTTKEPSFQACVEWLKDVKENCNPGTLVYLVGTKADLAMKKVTSTVAEDFRARNDITEKAEISAKTGEGIDALLEFIIRKQLDNQKIAESIPAIFGEKSVQRMTLKQNAQKEKEGCSC